MQKCIECKSRNGILKPIDKMSIKKLFPLSEEYFKFAEHRKMISCYRKVINSILFTLDFCLQLFNYSGTILLWNLLIFLSLTHDFKYRTCSQWSAQLKSWLKFTPNLDNNLVNNVVTTISYYFRINFLIPPISNLLRLVIITCVWKCTSIWSLYISEFETVISIIIRSGKRIDINISMYSAVVITNVIYIMRTISAKVLIVRDIS